MAGKSLIVSTLNTDACLHLQQASVDNILTTSKLADTFSIRRWKSIYCNLYAKKIKKNVKKSAEKFAGKEKSRTFATRLRKNGSSLTSLRKDNEVKLEEIKLKSVTREKKS